MDHQRYVEVADVESARFLAALTGIDLGAAVPSCPDWDAGDLLWHLAEVHGFWAQIAGGPLADPGEAQDQQRPPADELRAYAAARRSDLLDVLRSGDPGTRCWSWSELGGDLAWVARRQAHEALVHRVDAELAAGVEVSAPDAAVAADGVEELLVHAVCGVPAWATWSPDDTTIALRCTDDGARHVLRFGRMTGTSPASGRTYDLDAAELEPPSAQADAEVAGRAWDLDLWLWGRGPIDPLTVSGAPAALDRLRALLTEATQ